MNNPFAGNPQLTWRCAVIGLVALMPVVVAMMAGPEAPPPVTKWERAGHIHYQVRYVPGTDEACLILKVPDITPALEPHTCWR